MGTRPATCSGLAPGAQWILMASLRASAAGAGCNHGCAEQTGADGGDATSDRQPTATLLAGLDDPRHGVLDLAAHDDALCRLAADHGGDVGNCCSSWVHGWEDTRRQGRHPHPG